MYTSCPSCGYLLADKMHPYWEAMKRYEADKSDELEVKRGEVLDSLKITKWCCRLKVMGAVQIEGLLVPRDTVTHGRS